MTITVKLVIHESHAHPAVYLSFNEIFFFKGSNEFCVLHEKKKCLECQKISDLEKLRKTE